MCAQNICHQHLKVDLDVLNVLLESALHACNITHLEAVRWKEMITFLLGVCPKPLLPTTSFALMVLFSNDEEIGEVNLIK